MGGAPPPPQQHDMKESGWWEKTEQKEMICIQSFQRLVVLLLWRIER